MQISTQEIIELISVGTLIFLLAPAFLILYVGMYNRRKKRHAEEKEHLQATFRQELLKTQLEVQEETLTTISREIHDNITQVLSFVKLNMGMIDLPPGGARTKILQSRELVAQTINDLRNLSKSMSYEHIAMLGLVKTLEIEADRINSSGVITILLEIAGEPADLGEQRELVLFRIFQETLNNTLKHSGAKDLKISLQYSEQLFTLTLRDNGAGFSINLTGAGSGAGLKNIKSRAALIGATAVIDSSPGEGCSVRVTLNLIEQLINLDGTPTNRFG